MSPDCERCTIGHFFGGCQDQSFLRLMGRQRNIIGHTSMSMRRGFCFFCECLRLKMKSPTGDISRAIMPDTRPAKHSGRTPKLKSRRHDVTVNCMDSGRICDDGQQESFGRLSRICDTYCPAGNRTQTNAVKERCARLLHHRTEKSGARDSNSDRLDGKLSCCHYTSTAKVVPRLTSASIYSSSDVRLRSLSHISGRTFIHLATDRCRPQPYPMGGRCQEKLERQDSNLRPDGL